MSNKCRAYSASKIGLEKPDNRKAFYAGWDAAIEAELREAIEQAEKQEPVAWIPNWAHDRLTGQLGAVANPVTWGINTHLYANEVENTLPLHTAPPRDSWFKLTDAEVWDEWTRAVDESNSSNRVLAFRFARALEDKLKEKNT